MARRFFNAEGIVVRTRNLGESDRIVILLTPNRGLVHCVARSARNTKSKIGGQTDLLRHITAGINAGRSDLHIISQVETINAHLPIHTDLDRLTLASHMAESSELASTEGAANPALFHLLSESLTNAESAAPDKLPLLRLWHDVQLLTVSGWEPELHNCVRTGAVLTEGDHWWSATEGGVVAQNYNNKLNEPQQHTTADTQQRHEPATTTQQRHEPRTSTQQRHEPATNAQHRHAPATSTPTAYAMQEDPTLSAPLIPAPVDALKLLRHITRPTTTWHHLSSHRAITAPQTAAAQGLVTRLMEAVLDTRESRSARVGRAVRGVR